MKCLQTGNQAVTESARAVKICQMTYL